MNVLIRIPLIKFQVTKKKVTRETLSDSYCVNNLGSDTFLLTHRKIYKYQRKEKDLVAKLKHANYHTKYFVEVELPHS